MMYACKEARGEVDQSFREQRLPAVSLVPATRGEREGVVRLLAGLVPRFEIDTVALRRERYRGSRE